MIVSTVLELRDVPGQLVAALGPISESGGNIRSIIHHRGKRTPRNTIPVQITFEIERERLDGLRAKLKRAGIIVGRFGEERFCSTIVVVLIGHIVHSDVRDTIAAIDRTGFAEVVELQMEMPGVADRSSAALRISASGERELRRALEILARTAERKGLLLITPLEGR